MPREKGSFTVLDAAVFLVVAAGLVGAALGSGSLVPEPEEDRVNLPRPAIEFRDQLYGFAVPENGVLWLAGNLGKIVRSDDSGSSWRVQPTPTIANLQDLAAWDSERAVAVGNGGVVVITDDGGHSWAEVEAPRSEIVNKLFRVQTLEGGTAWAVGAGGMILVSQDWGASWERRSEQEDIAWNGLAFLDASRGWVVGEFGEMLRTLDGGETWQRLDSPVERSLMAVALRDPENGVAVGLDGLILRTEDGGDSWNVVSSGTTAHLFGVLWDGESWVVVGDGGMLVTSGPAARIWEAQPLGDHELGWHTEVARVGGRLVLVGASQGYRQDGEWIRFTG